MNVEDFKKYLEIDKSNLDEEIVHQPSLFSEVAEAHANAISVRDSLKEELATLDASLANELRKKIEKGGERATDARVQSATQQDKRHIKASNKYLEAKKEADILLALKESFQMRSYMIRDLAQLYSAQYFESTSVKITPTQKDYLYTKTKDKMRKKRFKSKVK